MTIYRGTGGGGDATTDSQITALAAYATQAQTQAALATTAAGSAATSASNASTSASNAAASAATAANTVAIVEALAGVAPPQTGNAGKYLTTNGTATSWDALSTVADTGAYADLTGKPTLGTAAATDASVYATAAQGTKADSALQSADIGVSVQAYNAVLNVAQITDKIQPILATVASNAMTITLNQTTLDFRSTTLGSGAVSTVTLGSAVTLVVPTLATLGTVSAQKSRLVVLAINNAGTIEAAVVNIAGGNDLSETGLISTTAISGSATANNVVYSTTARTSVAYRVVGYVESTQATAGTWATAPSTVQGCGGQALTSMSSLGYGQTWQNLTGSRALSTTYYNTTGKPIQLAVTGYSSAASLSGQVVVNGTTVVVSYSQANGSGGVFRGHVVQTIIPAGANYNVQLSSGTIDNWNELR